MSSCRQRGTRSGQKRSASGSTPLSHLDARWSFALLGPNGAGKTTTIEILEGFRMRSAGAASVLGILINVTVVLMVGLILVGGELAPDSTGWLTLIGVLGRAALLPDAAKAAEIGESWRLVEMVGVLGAWALVGFVTAPVILRRMARRESGSAMQERRDRAMQRFG